MLIHSMRSEKFNVYDYANGLFNADNLEGNDKQLSA